MLPVDPVLAVAAGAAASGVALLLGIQAWQVAAEEAQARSVWVMPNPDVGRPKFTRAYSFGIATGIFFLLSWVGQFVTQLYVEMWDAQDHGQAFEFHRFFVQFLASTFENWQSEFLQLLWQAAGLALLLWWGSSQSREGDARIEAKLDALLAAQGVDAEGIAARVNREA